MLVERAAIEDLTRRIVREFRPERVVLFGSYAHGTATCDSDVDLLVVMRFQGSGGAQAVEIMRRVRPRIPLDLVVRTPEDMRQRLAWNDFFLQEIDEKGEVLYESPHARVGIQG